MSEFLIVQLAIPVILHKPYFLITSMSNYELTTGEAS